MTLTRKARLRAARLGRALDKSRPPWMQLQRDPLLPCHCGHSRKDHKGQPLRCLVRVKGKKRACDCAQFHAASRSLNRRAG